MTRAEIEALKALGEKLSGATLDALHTDRDLLKISVPVEDAADIAVGLDDLCTALIESMDRVEELEFGLAAAVQIAGEAAEEWDKAPEGMRAGKILLALAGHRPRYRPDTDAIHAALAARKSLGGSNER